MTEAEFVVKQRPIWHPAAWRLLREGTCASRAAQAVPASVDGIRIRFPQTDIALRLSVRVRSRRLAGESLMEMLYRPEMRETCLDLGMALLRGLQEADLARFGQTPLDDVYQRGRALQAQLLETTGRRRLSDTQKRVLAQLLRAYVSARGAPRALVHGDLQASHVIVDVPERTIGVIDLEAMRAGQAVTNFAQLWEAYHFADQELGRLLYERYKAANRAIVDARFDARARAELALRCLSHLRTTERSGDRKLGARANQLLVDVLSGASFEEICLGGERDEHTTRV